MLIHLDQRLKNELAKAISGKISCIFRTECTFINPNTSYKETVYIRNLNIIQDFTGSYTDNIVVITEVTPTQYKELQSNMQGLECGITLYPVSTLTGDDLETQDPIIIEGLVFLPEQLDLDKQTNATITGDPESKQPESGSQAEAYVMFQFEVMSKRVHDLRQMKVNAIFSGSKMEDVLHWSTQQFDMEEATIVPPDSSATIGAIVIPPVKGIDDLYPYLQDRYGIYAKGMSYYYVDDHLYIYPSFDTDINHCVDKDRVAHFVNGVGTEWYGVGHYHNFEDDDVYIAAIANAEVSPVNTAAAENNGNVIASANADTANDRNVTVEQNGTVTKNDGTMAVISRQNNAGNMASSMQNIKYGGNTSNVYNATSALASEDGSILKLTWINAYPWVLIPGQHVEYHYLDSNSEYQTLPGVLQGIFFQSESVPLASQKRPGITFTAGVQIFLAPERQDDQTVQYTQR